MLFFTGGMFALFDGQMQQIFRDRNAHKTVQVWKAMTDEAPYSATQQNGNW